jgi:hypothetical protein
MLALTLVCGAAVGGAAAVAPAAGVLCVVAVALALVLVQRPRTAVYLMVMVAPACAGLRRGLVVPGLRVSEVGIACLAGLVLVFAPRARTPAWSRVELVLLGYAGATCVLGGLDLALRHAPLTGSELGTLLGPFQFVLLVRAVVVALGDARHRVRAVQLMLVAAALVGLVSLLQLGNVGPTRHLLATVTGSQLYATSLAGGVGRVTGPFNFWHELAGFLMPSVLLSLALLVKARTARARLCYGAVLALAGSALLATASAGPLIATALAGLYVAWRLRALTVVLAASLPVVLVVTIGFGGTLSGRAAQQYTGSASTYRLPLVPETLSFRYAVFREQSVPALSGRWASGYGPDLPPQFTLGNFPYTETAYVTLLLRGGAPLLAIFVVLMAAVAMAARRAQRSARSSFEGSVATVVLALTASYAVLQLIESYLLDAGPPQAYWAVVGLMVAAANRGQDEAWRS